MSAEISTKPATGKPASQGGAFIMGHRDKPYDGTYWGGNPRKFRQLESLQKLHYPITQLDYCRSEPRRCIAASLMIVALPKEWC